MAIWVTLTPEQIEWADKVGLFRHENRKRAGSIHRNNRPRNWDIDLENDKSAARCELAGHIGLETSYWNDYQDIVGKSKQPDLDHFIDVKERRFSRHRLIIQFTDPASWAYVSVCSEQHPDYCIDAWCWGYEVQHEKYRKALQPGRPAYVVEMIDPVIKNPRKLMEIIKQRALEKKVG
jgi:hypothetical protein